MVVLTIASSKGGPGKTTCAMVLAGTLAAEGLRVVVLDADPTQAFSRWASSTYEGQPFQCVAEADERRLAEAIERAAATADVVLIDTAGFGNITATVAMTMSDAVMVPALSGEADINEAERTVQRVQTMAKAARREIPVRLPLNRTKKTQLARHAVAELARAGLPRLEAGLSDLVAFGEMSFSGRVPSAGPAGAEIAALVAELRGLGWLPAQTAVHDAVNT